MPSELGFAGANGGRVDGCSPTGLPSSVPKGENGWTEELRRWWLVQAGYGFCNLSV
jgi:hypothetical protein